PVGDYAFPFRDAVDRNPNIKWIGCSNELNVLRGRTFNHYLSARTSGRRCTSSTKLASKGEELSLLQARASDNGMFKSTTGVMTTLLGHRHRAVPRTHPTPKPVATRLKIVASFTPSCTMRGTFSPPRKHSRIRRSYNAGLSLLGNQTKVASARSRRRSFLSF